MEITLVSIKMQNWILCHEQRNYNKKPLANASGFIGIRRRPTLPGRVQPSTIGAEGLNFCVRDGNRWNPFAITTGNLFSRFGTSAFLSLPASQPSALLRPRYLPYLDNCTDFGLLPFARLVSVFLKSSPRPISISKLPCYHAYTADLSPGSLPGVLLV